MKLTILISALMAFSFQALTQLPLTAPSASAVRSGGIQIAKKDWQAKLLGGWRRCEVGAVTSSPDGVKFTSERQQFLRGRNRSDIRVAAV